MGPTGSVQANKPTALWWLDLPVLILRLPGFPRPRCGRFDPYVHPTADYDAGVWVKQVWTFAQNRAGPESPKLATLGIPFERYAKRIPQRGLFEESTDDSEPIGRSLSMPALPTAPAFICSTSTIDRTFSALIRFVTRVRKTPSSFFNSLPVWYRNRKRS